MSNLYSFGFSGKVTIVTGSEHKIGAAIAKRFAALGAAVVVNGNIANATVDRTVAETVGSRRDVIGIMADVSDADDGSSAAGFCKWTMPNRALSRGMRR
jgi:NAD(P)-dependent dehydrogenase (short-subunit alcohol dehydrogenase family)